MTHLSRLFLIILYAAGVLTVASCRREAAAPGPAGSGPTATSTTLTGTPQDLRNAQINTAVAPDTGQFVSNSKVGAALGPDGLVADEKSEFAPADPIHISLWLAKSPPGLQTRAVLEDASGKAVDVKAKPMSGEPTVTFTLGNRKLAPGKYKVVGYWGGNIAAEHEITVGAPAPPARPAKGKGKPGKA